jgi:AraC family transcriptional regulator
MSIDAALLATGEGWLVQDLRCTYGPQDRPFEEQHRGISIAIVTSGSFTYRTNQGTALLAPGAVLLGNEGQCFECAHEHGAGDRCLSFHLAPQFVESVVGDLPGARQLTFTRPSLPPIPALIPVVANALMIRSGCGDISLEELALSVVGTMVTVQVARDRSGGSKRPREPSKRDQQRVTGALRRIETQFHDPLSLRQLAADAAMSPYHFLRTFRAVAGVTPHQYLLHTRLQHAATRLRSSDDKIAEIAVEAGFNDLSTFNHRFRRLLGASPGAYRSSRLPDK